MSTITLDERLEEVANGDHIGYERIVFKEVRMRYWSVSRWELAEVIRDFAIDAAYRYKDDRGASWTTYLRYYLHWQTSNWLRTHRTRTDSIRSLSYVNKEHACGITDPELRRLEVDDMLSMLSNESRDIFFALLPHGLPASQRVSAGYISRTTGRSIYYCRKFVQEVKGLQRYL